LCITEGEGGEKETHTRVKNKKRGEEKGERERRFQGGSLSAKVK
jgi:hypothetical protein